jgi:hypothetical protein
MTRARLFQLIGFLVLLICLLPLDIHLMSVMKNRRAAQDTQSESAKLYSLQPAPLKSEIAKLKIELGSLPVKIRIASEKNTWISELSAKAVEYRLDLTSLTPSDAGASDGLEKQIILIDLLGSYKNTLFFFDDLVRSGYGLSIPSISMRCDRAGEPIRTHAEIHLLWSAE